MNRNDKVMIGQLIVGDRFCNIGQSVAWQIIATGTNKAFVNQIVNGKRLHLYDATKKNETEVIFLRNVNDK